MLKSIVTYTKLCVLRGNPADVDGRTPALVIFFLILLVLDSAFISVPLWWSLIDSSPSVQSIGEEVLRVFGKVCSLLFVALCIYVVLQVRRAPQNFRQIFSAYLGVSIVITLAALVLVVGTFLISSHQALEDSFDWRVGSLTIDGTTLVRVWLWYFVSTAWKVLALGYILHKSMEVKFWHGGVVAIMLIYAPGALGFVSQFFGYVVAAITNVLG